MYRNVVNRVKVSGTLFSRIIYSIAFVFIIAATTLHAQGTDETQKAIEAFTQGQDAHAKGDLKAAIVSYKEALAIIERFPEAEYQLGMAFRELGDIELAERSLRRAVEFREDWSLALSGLGSLLVERGKYSDAEPILKRAIELDDRNFPAYSALVDLLVRTDSSKERISALLPQIKELSEKANPTASIFIARGIAENALGDNSSAAASFLRARAIDPKSVSAVRELTFIAIKNGDVERARSLIAELEKLSSADRSLPILKANLFLLDGRNKEADEVLAGIENPSQEIIALRKKIADGAITDPAELEERLKNDPKNAVAAGRLCLIYRTKDPIRAQELCRLANELEPENINHAVGYASALIAAKDFAAGIELLRRLAKLQPENSTIRANLAAGYFHSKEYNAAKPEFLWLTENQPEIPITYYYLGIIHDNLGEYMDAAARYQEFLRRADPSINQLEIDKVNLRMPALQRQIKNNKGR